MQWGMRAPVSEEEDVIKEVVDFRGGLQQGHERGEVHVVRRIAQILRHRVRCRAVQPRADLVHQQHFLQQPRFPLCHMCQVSSNPCNSVLCFVSRVPGQQGLSSLRGQQFPPVPLGHLTEVYMHGTAA